MLGFDCAAADAGNGGLLISPDPTELYGMSGGPALTMRVPSSAADGPLLCEGTELLTFVEYLRTCLRNDGFLNGRLPCADERPPPL